MTGLHKCFQYFSGFIPAGVKKTLPRISHDPVGRTPRHALWNFSRKKSKISDLLVYNIGQNLAKKLDPALKTAIYLKEISYLTRSYALTKVQMSTPFLRDKTLEFCARVLRAHPEVCPSFFFLFVFSPKIVGLRWSTFSEKSKLTKNQATKKNKKTLREVFATAHKRRVQIFTV